MEDSHRDLKCRKARPRWLRIQKPEALMLQSVPPYVDTPFSRLLPSKMANVETARDAVENAIGDVEQALTDLE